MSIRNRTGYSFRTAIGDIEASNKKIASITGGFAPITDTASAFGFTRWSKLCKKNEVKPVFGIELAVSDSINAKKPGYDYWTFVAKDSLLPIHELLKTATSQFRYVPLLTFEQALTAPGVFAIAGHRTDFKKLVQSDAYVALSPNLSKAQYELGHNLGLSFVAASDNRYLEEDDRDLFAVSLGRDAALQSYPQHLLTDNEWHLAMSWVRPQSRKAALKMRNDIFKLSNAHQVPGTLLIAQKPKTLMQMCKAGAKLLGCNLKDPVYKARLERELELIHDKKFEDYFYIIADLCQWARQRMIVGPARGSSCGSLACYLLQITTVDPIPYGLIFERFIDVNRNDLPDIDIDFSDTKRHLVFEYMAEKYGREHIARLGTVALFRPRSALQAAAETLDIPRWKIDRVVETIIKRSGGDSRALQATEDTLKDTAAGKELLAEHPEILIAGRMEGQPRHHSQHAAGVILTELPVMTYVAVDARTDATHCDKKDAEELGLLKIDALGLTQLSVFEDCLEMAGLPRNFLDNVPLDDPLAFKVLNDGKFSGIFQFMGIALQSITNQIEVKDLNDIVSITALARPGPINTGGTHQWIKVKTGRSPIVMPHKLFEPHLSETLGVVAYQEQVMNIGREIGDLSWGDVTALRKAMSKSLGKEYFDQFGDKWKAGARAKGIPDEVLEKVWDDLCAYGSWAFNKSHAVAYGLISYYCCWLKAHHPVEFGAATLSRTATTEEQIKMLRELVVEGVNYVPVDRELSDAMWKSGVIDNRRVLIGPLSLVKGIGPKMLMQVLSARARGEPLTGRAAKLLQDPVTDVDSLFPIGDKFKQLMPDPAERNIHTPVTRIVNIETTGQEYEVLVFCTISKIAPKDENEEINVAKRGYAVKGPTQSINLRLTDDTGTIFAKINRFQYAELGTPVLERGRVNKALYAIKGRVPKDFLMISVSAVRYIGDLDDNGEVK